MKKKGKDKHDYVHDRKYKHGRNRRYHKKKYKNYYYPDIYWIYDDTYYDVGYYDYTYINDSDLIYPSPIYEYKQPRKIPLLNSSVEAAYLGKDIRDILIHQVPLLDCKGKTRQTYLIISL